MASTQTVKEYLDERGIVNAYIVVTEKAISLSKTGKSKWTVDGMRWSHTSDSCKWSTADWKRHAGNSRETDKAFEPQDADVKIGARRTVEFLAYPSSRECVVLDIENVVDFRKGYPEVDMARARK